jgi:glycerophosphoryl diester phosphodiesterase
MTWLYITLGAIALLIVLLCFAIGPAKRKHPDRKILSGMYIAHRGLHGLTENCPENSAAAFFEAVKRGFAIETDIHLSSDGEVFVFHDNDLKRMCGSGEKVEELTFEKLRQYRLAGTDERIMSLKELLNLVNGAVPLMIEFKSESAKGCDKLCAAANEILKDYKGKYFIQSFNPFILKWYKKNRPDICRGQLSCRMKGSISYFLLGRLLLNFVSRPDFVSYQASDHKVLNRRLTAVLGAHQTGWTIRSEEELNEARKHFKTYIFEGFIPE